MQANLQRHNYDSLISHFESGNCGKEGRKNATN